MAALKLGENFTPTGSARRTRQATSRASGDGEQEFILGFFQYGAASFALPYIRTREMELSLPDLRQAAEALASIGQWAESIRLVSRYMRRDDYITSREDFYLFYPRPFAELIEKYAAETELRPEILFGLIRTESFFEPDAVSHAGAVGLAQLMPATAADMAARLARRGGPDFRNPNGIDLKNPEVNIHLGAFYLRHLKNQMGSPMLALLAYNGGQGRVRRWLTADRQREGGLPIDLFLETIAYHETRQYGRLVLAAAAVYGYLYYGMSMEETALNIFR